MYQVRFEWGIAGLQALAGHSDVLVLADALPSVPLGSAEGRTEPPTSLASHRVIHATFRNRKAVADWVVKQQEEKGDRFSVAVIGVGEVRADGSLRPAVEDLLAAGAVIDALSDAGIDHCSPEAGAASAAFVGMKRTLKHVLSGSESGQALHGASQTRLVHEAAVLDDSAEVPEITEFAFPG
jgi:2-phosphosulfolactate phosphatase